MYHTLLMGNYEPSVIWSTAINCQLKCFSIYKYDCDIVSFQLLTELDIYNFVMELCASFKKYQKDILLLLLYFISFILCKCINRSYQKIFDAHFAKFAFVLSTSFLWTFSTAVCLYEFWKRK